MKEFIQLSRTLRYTSEEDNPEFTMLVQENTLWNTKEISISIRRPKYHASEGFEAANYKSIEELEHHAKQLTQYAVKAREAESRLNSKGRLDINA